MTTETNQYHVHTAGTKVMYPVNDGVNGNSIKCQVTLGGRILTTAKVMYRPYLIGKPAVELTDFEIAPNGIVTFAPVANVINHTVSIDQLRLSYILVDDTGNDGGDGDIWVHISQF